MQRNARRYRCTFAPATPEGLAHPIETGVLPFLAGEANNAEAALRIAQQRTGKPVVDATRIEPTPSSAEPRTKTRKLTKAARIKIAGGIIAALQGQTPALA